MLIKKISILFTILILLIILLSTTILPNTTQWIGSTNQFGEVSREGDVNIGGTTSAKLKVRNIVGKSATSNAIDNLYLNYDTGRHVFIGFGGKKSNLYINGETTISGGWLRLRGKRGIYFQDYGGGFRMVDNTWIRTYGGKNFYHDTGIMRTDGSFHVGPQGNRLLVREDGNVGISTTTPDYKLDVNGTIRAKEVRVQTGWSDHVFLPEYQLPTLQEEKAFIKGNGHLLGFESEHDMGGEVKLADVTNRQQETIEKMMLHIIKMNEVIEALKSQIEARK